MTSAEYQKQYRESHKEQLKAYSHAYWQKHKERIKADRAKNPEKRREYQKQFYNAHKNDPEYIAKAKAYHAEWQRNNKERLKEYRRAWRTKKRLEAIIAVSQCAPTESVTLPELAIPQNIRGAIDERGGLE